MDQGYWIPRTLDDPKLLLFVEIDTGVIFLTTFLICLLFNFVFAAIFSYFITRGYVYLKENGDRGLIARLCYWYLPSEFWLSKFWPSHKREYCGR